MTNLQKREWQKKAKLDQDWVPGRSSFPGKVLAAIELANEIRLSLGQERLEKTRFIHTKTRQTSAFAIYLKECKEKKYDFLRYYALDPATLADKDRLELARLYWYVMEPHVREKYLRLSAMDAIRREEVMEGDQHQEYEKNAIVLKKELEEMAERDIRDMNDHLLS